MSGAARGFSLVEVLIAVVVLALGILGLAAIFPAVIAQQRSAQSETLGSVVSSTAKIMLQRQTSTLGWDRLDRDITLSSNGNCTNTKLDGMWGVFDWGGVDQPLDAKVLSTYRKSGALLFGGGGECLGGNAAATFPQRITFYPDDTNPDALFAHERLLPEPFSGPDPQFVWDFVPRKVGSGGGRTTLQVAVFVRRIDANIRVPSGKKLAQLFYTDDFNVAPAAFPVAVEVGGARNGMPSNNGKGEYAVPKSMQALTNQKDIIGGKVKVLNLTGDANQIRLVAQPGQKLVDNLGVVRTVVKAITNATGSITGVEVTPSLNAGETTSEFTNSEAGRMLQVVYTPQVPVDVVIITP